MTTSNLITGLHHVTAMASSPQQNVDFYVGILGLRLVKKTVNFDAPDVYHLYYGDESGNPGSIMTFFPFKNMRPGRHGKGQAATTTFSIPTGSVDYWLKRFEQFKVKHKAPQKRFDEVVIYFEDFDGLGLELIATDKDTRAPFTYGHIPLGTFHSGLLQCGNLGKHLRTHRSLTGEPVGARVCSRRGSTQEISGQKRKSGSGDRYRLGSR
jgi:glyoxalase family protein